jgi:hypothetical protein
MINQYVRDLLLLETVVKRSYKRVIMAIIFQEGVEWMGWDA